MTESLVRVKNPHGAKFVVSRRHYEDYKNSQNLELLGIYVPILTKGLFVVDRLCYYADRIFPVGHLNVCFLGDSPIESQSYTKTYLDEKKRSFTIWLPQDKETVSVEDAKDSFVHYRFFSDLNEVSGSLHFIIVGRPYLERLSNPSCLASLPVRRGGLLCLCEVDQELMAEDYVVLGVSEKIRINIPKAKWEWLKPLETHRAPGIEVFRRLI